MAAYQNSLEHLRDELRRLDLLLGRAVAEFRARRDGEQAGEFHGLFISDAEVDGLLSRADDGPRAVSEADELAAAGRGIRQRVAESRGAGVFLRLPHLCAVFGLDSFESDALLLALAPELDLRYQKLYAFLQDDISRRLPSVELALRLLCRTPDERAGARHYFSEGSGLSAHSLLSLREEASEGPAPLLNRTLKLDDRVVEFLQGSDRIDQRLTAGVRVARCVAPRRDAPDLLLGEEAGAALERVVAFAGAEPPRVCLLHGPAGVGKKAFAETVCRRTNRLLLITHLPSLLRSALPFQSLLRASFREAMLYNGAIYLDAWHELLQAEAGEQPRVSLIEQEVERFPGLVFLGSHAPWQPDGERRYRFVSVEVPLPDPSLRRQLWGFYLNHGTPVAEGVDADYLAGAFRFSGGQIRQALTHAQTNASLRQGEDCRVTHDDLLAGCRALSSRRIVSFARKITPARAWADLVLPKDPLAQLHELCQQVRFRARVFEDWGFGERLSLGKGLVALFTGSSGTGKTLSAEIIARDLGLDLYRIDLSCVVSKYIGETEKNMSRVFEDAQQSNAILFFDEADALFGKRSEVRDAHDRYANIETAYLLQRVEEYEGAIILASNLSRNIDEAFLRRMNFTVEFPFPDEAHRLRIWRGIFPRRSPLADDVDFDFLARKFKIAGGNIKNAALAAAFLAAGDGGAIRMCHLVRGIRREYQKLGKVCERGDFEQYYELVR